MKDNIAICVNNVTKTYKLYDNHADRVKETFHPFRKKYHRTFNALSDISFQVKKGETLGIIGRNGSGKSTLLQIVCGILQATSGSVKVNGKVSALLELGAGFNPEFTGRQNVYINASILGLTGEQIDERFDDIIAFADIGDFFEQPVKTYSSGMVVRLAFAVIAHVDAHILVIDEALAVGDFFFVQKCMRFLRNFMGRGTLLFVSHDPGAVLNLCDRAILLDKGRIDCFGNSKSVTEKYLASIYEAEQGASCITQNDRGLNEVTHNEFKDMRLEFINTTRFRNDIELFVFQPDSPSFGKGGATIISVIIADDEGASLKWVVGGENISLVIKCLTHTDFKSPIVGFFIKDRLGQTLFGDNTFLTYRLKPFKIFSGQVIQAEFNFRMPLLPVGDYSISVAIAEGTQEEHIQHHWFHDALVFKSHSSSIRYGLIGVPMQKIRLSVAQS
jgi:lipopolysaccharide transport system ATP-binding protein